MVRRHLRRDGDRRHRGVNHLVMGPWKHGQWFTESGDRSARPLGQRHERLLPTNIEAPWFAYWLKDKGDGQFARGAPFSTRVQSTGSVSTGGRHAKR